MSLTNRAPIIRIANGTFYRHHPGTRASNPPLFRDLTFDLPSVAPRPRNWCIVGPSLSGKTTLLQVLRGRLLCQPAGARSYPYLSGPGVPSRLRTPDRAIEYVGFDSEGLGTSNTVTQAAYLSARYESRRETTDFSLRDYLLGNTHLNPLQRLPGDDDDAGASLLPRVADDLRLTHLLDLPVTFLSNGQGRRARIARALLRRPEVLLLDEPFMGLDPPTVARLSPVLRDLAARAAPRVLLAARPQDPLPDWVTHLVYLRADAQVAAMGPKDEVLDHLRTYAADVERGARPEDPNLPAHTLVDVGRVLPEKPPQAGTATTTTGQTTSPYTHTPADPDAEPLVEMEGCRVRYGDKVALGNWAVDGREGLHWAVRRGERWGVFGPNGSGKTTIVSLLCSDHPQAYSLPLRLFGRSRLPEPGSGKPPLTIWDVQTRIGHSSPEVHQLIPRRLTIRQVVQSAWSSTFVLPPRLDDEARAKVDAALRWFAPELNPSHSSERSEDPDLSWADDHVFGGVSFSAQRVALLLRAIIKSPDVVVLDEAFSGMDDAVRDKCTLFLEHGEAKTLRYGTQAGPHRRAVVDSGVESVRFAGLAPHQALICIAHVKEEVPPAVREWVCLPEANTGEPARFGRLDGPLGDEERRWRDVWGFE